MMPTITIAPVRKTIRVKANQAHAFEVFTSGLGRWWPLDHGIGKTPRKAAVMETRLGGRWYELAEDGTETPVGKIIAWEPPQRFVVTWDINSQWQPDNTVSSEVEVSFIAEGANATRVRAGAPQVRADGYRARREDAQGGRRRLAGIAGALQERGRGLRRPTYILATFIGVRR